MITTKPLVHVDCETTSLNPGRLPWEIAMIRDEDGATEEMVLQVTNIDLSDADPEALWVGKFFQRHRSWAMDPGSVDGIHADEGTCAFHVHRLTMGAVVVGSNPMFDMVTLDAMLRRHRLSPAWHYRPIDVVDFACGYLRAKGVEVVLPSRLADVADLLGIDHDPQSRHTALGDARLAKAVLEATM